MESLFLLLGTGQSILKNIDNRDYKTTKYCLKSDPNRKTIESPFVGEAIVKLKPNSFSKIFIFGTKHSMWDTLYMHINRNVEDLGLLNSVKNNFAKIWKAIELGNIDTQKDVIEILNDSLSEYFQIPTECVIVPIGESESELWMIFDKLVNLNQVRGTISFDITHGLRYHPFFFLISLFYLNSVTDGQVKIGSIFYGALELQNSPEYNGITPILEFSIFSEIIKWINAAELFSKYKDPDALAKLLDKYNEMNELSDIIKNYSFAYNANDYTKILNYSELLIKKLEKKTEKPTPFRLIEPKLKKNAFEIISQETTTKKLLKIAQQQFHAHNYTETIIALYEAVIEEYRSQKNIDQRYNAHNEFTMNLKNLKEKIISNNINNFHTNLQLLKKLRNNISHLNQTDKNELNIDTIKDLFNYFYGNLEKVRFS